MPDEATTGHLDDHDQLPPPTLEEVSPGVYAYIQLDGTWGLNNAGFITGVDALSVIDTCFTEARTRAFLQAIRGVTDLPIRTLVNTHHHGDHTHGNYLFRGASIVGHDLCREAFQERLDLFVDDLRMELHYVGPAHTTNDSVVWLPERKLMFTGDLAFNGGTPFVAMGSIAGSLVALDRLREFGAETVVPGHGPVCGPEVFDDMEAYLRFVQALARDAFAEGLSPLAAAQQTDLGRFDSWHDSERLAGNLHRAYSELRGESRGTSLALGPIADDMVAYNGGQPVRCLA